MACGPAGGMSVLQTRICCFFPAFWVSWREHTRLLMLVYRTASLSDRLSTRNCRGDAPEELQCLPAWPVKTPNAIDQLAAARSAEPASPHDADAG